MQNEEPEFIGTLGGIPLFRQEHKKPGRGRHCLWCFATTSAPFGEPLPPIQHTEGCLAPAKFR